MNLKKLFGTMAVSAAMLLASYAPVAAAGCLEKPGLVSVNLGALWLASSDNFLYDAGTLNVNAANVPALSVDTHVASVDMSNNDFNGYVAISADYLNVESGMALGLRLSWNQLDLSTNENTNDNAFNADAFGAYVMLSYHSLASPAHDSDSSVGFTAAIGVGAQWLYDVSAVIPFAGKYSTTTAGTPPTTTTGTYEAVTEFTNYDDVAFSGIATVGIEFAMNGGGLFGINLTGIWNSSMDALSGGVSATKVNYASVAAPTVTKAANDWFGTDGSMDIPSTFVGVVDVRFGYNFGGM